MNQSIPTSQKQRQMKKLIIPFLVTLFLASCGMENMTDIQPDQKLEEKNAAAMSNKKNIDGQQESGILSNGKGNGKSKQVMDIYTLQGTMADGLATGFILKPGLPVTLSASGQVGFYWAGLADPATPNGRPNVGFFNGFPLISLVARVGGGELQFIGAGPTQLTGSGELVLYINDNFFADNTGAWNVTVSYDCYPGYGYGDQNHYHCK
jgi:hypothetical protein